MSTALDRYLALRQLIPQQPQRHDSLTEELEDLVVAANRLGCYDAADWLKAILTLARQACGA